MDKTPISSDLPPIGSYYQEAYQRSTPQRRRFVQKAKNIRRLRGATYNSSDKETKDPLKEAEVVKVHCPHRGCGSPVLLLCPHCRNGALEVDKEQLILYCTHCYGVVKEVACAQGHRIRGSYIREKQKVLKGLREHSDKIPWLATFMGFALFAIGIEFVIYVLGYLGNY